MLFLLSPAKSLDYDTPASGVPFTQPLFVRQAEPLIKALRKIRPGEELFFDYQLIIDERYTAKLKARYACWCGAKTCRGTMLAPKT